MTFDCRAPDLPEREPALEALRSAIASAATRACRAALVTAVPEPATLLLWLAGLGSLAALRRSDRLGACPPSPQN